MSDEFTVEADVDEEDAVLDPMVGYAMYEDGNAHFEFRDEHGIVSTFEFTNAEKLRDISCAFKLAADQNEEILAGGFQELKERFEHLGDDTITVEDFNG
jgi:hypothetical protein